MSLFGSPSVANRVVIEVNQGIATLTEAPDEIEVYIVDHDAISCYAPDEFEEWLENFPADMHKKITRMCEEVLV